MSIHQDRRGAKRADRTRPAKGFIMTDTIRRLSSIGASTAVILAALAAHAQLAPTTPATPHAASATVGEVIVTAQRRSENLEKVPLAVSSFNAGQLAASQIGSTQDLAKQVPNMFASNNVGLGSANVYYIRGLGQTQSFPTFEPQVSTYVDDIYIGRQNANNLSLFGVQQVQVLRGPQGTLFGRNSTGGAILVTLQKPGDTFGGDLTASYGAYHKLQGTLSVDMPINDQFLTRTSMFGIRDDGYADDLTTHERLNTTRDYGFREAIRILPASMSGVEWNLSADYSNNNNANVLNFPGDGGVNGSDRIAYTGFSSVAGGALVPYLTGDKSHLAQGADDQSFGFASNFAVKTQYGTLSLITGFRGLNQANAIDFPDSALGPLVPYDTFATGQFNLAQEQRSSQYSQEIKFDGDVGRLRYTVGVFGLYEQNRNDFGAVANLGPLVGAPYFPDTLGDEFTKNNTTSGAVYAQGDYSFTDKLKLTLGGRYTHEVKTLNVFANTPGGFDTADIQAAGYKTRLTTDQFTPRVALSYQADPTLLLFASATRGFQGGGWNGLAFNAATFNDFGPETVWSYEGGFRKETADHRIRLNVTGFYTDVSKYQLLSDNVQAASFVTTNAADLRSYGAEADFTWQPIDPLTLGLNLGLIDAKYRNPSAGVQAQQAACQAAPGPANASCGSGIVNGSGNLAPPTYTPPLTATVNASYRIDLNTFTLTPTASVQYTAREAVGTEGLPPSFDKSRVLLDFGMTLAPTDQPWTLTAECKNCTMVDYGTTYLFGYRYYNYPGSWDVRVSYKF
jgi:iron complex outermembrane receptor protein